MTSAIFNLWNIANDLLSLLQLEQGPIFPLQCQSGISLEVVKLHLILIQLLKHFYGRIHQSLQYTPTSHAIIWKYEFIT